MLTKTELGRLYETLLSIPGMNDPVRMDLKIPRKKVLQLSQVIRRGLANSDYRDEPCRWLIDNLLLKDSA